MLIEKSVALGMPPHADLTTAHALAQPTDSMGLGCLFLAELLDLKRSGALNGRRVVEIGAQQLANSFLDDPRLPEVYAEFAAKPITLGTSVDCGRVGAVDLQPKDAPSSERFWRSIGFDYAAVEYNGHRGVISLDLNRDAVPAEMRGQFDLVVNTGTTEHVANQENAFRVIHDLTAPKGIMIHEVPGGGMMSHGLFNYNLKFFHMLCKYNNYQVIKLATVPSGPVSVSPDVIGSNLRWGGGDLCAQITVYDFTLTAILRKTDRDFMTPLDIPV